MKPFFCLGRVQLKVKPNKDHSFKGKTGRSWLNASFTRLLFLNIVLHIDFVIFFFLSIFLLFQMADCGGLPQVVQVS